MVTRSGSKLTPLRIRVGNQYPALSAVSWQVVLPVTMVAAVEFASVAVLPTKVWLWEAPGLPGNTIGSSLRWWETAQLACISWNAVRTSGPGGGGSGATGADAFSGAVQGAAGIDMPAMVPDPHAAPVAAA